MPYQNKLELPKGNNTLTIVRETRTGLGEYITLHQVGQIVTFHIDDADMLLQAIEHALSQPAA